LADEKTFLIAFEGIDGAGKSTQVDIQYSRLQDMQIPTQFIDIVKRITSGEE